MVKMIASNRNIKSKDLRSSTRGVIAMTGSSRLQPSSCLTSNRRAFSWGAKYVSSSSSHGRDLQDKMKKPTAVRLVYRYPFLDQQLFPRRYLFNQGWRLASSWRRRNNTWERTDQEPIRESPIQQHDEGHWYSRWELQKKKQYEEFKKRVDEDPFSALFGRSNRWLGWTNDTETSAARTVKPDKQAYSSDVNAERDVQGMKQRADTRDKVNMDKDNSRDQQSFSPNATKAQEEEYYIDPITMRKVPRSSTPPISSVDISTQDTIRTSEIPVKSFKPSSMGTIMNEPPIETFAGVKDWTTAPKVSVSAQDWLVQEGFDCKESNVIDKKLADASPKAKMSKIESALERHLQGKTTDAERHGRPALLYEARERRTDDVDLLRASDVRASAGLRGRAAKENASEKHARQTRLEELHGNQNSELENRLSKEVAAKKIQEMKPEHSVKDKATTGGQDVSYLNEISDPEHIKSSSKDSTVQTSFKGNEDLSNENSKGGNTPRTDKATRITAKLVSLKAQIDVLKADYDAMRQRWLEEIRRSKTSKKTHEMHDEEVKTQKAAMEAMEMRGMKQNTGGRRVPTMAEAMERGEGDVATNVHEFASRARWYKRKAPHAKDEMDAKLQRIANDRLFVREIRSIYEETYGTIDAQHRQPQANDKTTARVYPKHRPSTTEDLSSEVLRDPQFSNSISGTSSSSPIDKEQPPPLNETQTIDALAITQELADELGKVQSIIHHHRAQFKRNESNQNLAAMKPYAHNVLQMAKAAFQLARTTPGLHGDNMAKVLMDTAAASNTNAASTSVYAKSLSATRPLSTSAANTGEPFSIVDEQAAVNPAGNPSASKPPASDTAPPPTTYRILAYDSFSQKITSVKTTSLTPFDKEQPLTPLEALVALQNPAKFLTQVMALHHKGYDIIGGAPNILVMKKVRNPRPTAESTTSKSDEQLRRPNPIDGTTSTTGNYASPTGFVNHDSVIPPEELEKHRTSPTPSAPGVNPSTAKVHREEDVFSGSSRREWQDTTGKRLSKKNKRDARRRKTFRRMLLTGTVTAACCYAVGVAVEFMRV